MTKTLGVSKPPRGANCNIEVRSVSRRPYFVKFKFAKELVAQGRAEFIEERAIRLITRPIVAVSSELIQASNQGATYELSAIDKHTQCFNGGLVRTEHKPFKFEQWKGARVGHQ